ncbi:MAG: hypothetical protein GEV28_37830 [Actinophytocola sp.]|nr:hypothetical protein [Actinophytocola sp.]
MIRYRTHPEKAEENQKLVEAVFAELAEKAPEGLRYMVFRLADGVSFTHLVISEEGGASLGDLTAFTQFTEGVGERAAVPPERVESTVVGSYGFLA